MQPVRSLSIARRAARLPPRSGRGPRRPELARRHAPDGPRRASRARAATRRARRGQLWWRVRGARARGASPEGRRLSALWPHRGWAASTGAWRAGAPGVVGPGLACGATWRSSAGPSHVTTLKPAPRRASASLKRARTVGEGRFSAFGSAFRIRSIQFPAGAAPAREAERSVQAKRGPRTPRRSAKSTKSQSAKFRRRLRTMAIPSDCTGSSKDRPTRRAVTGSRPQAHGRRLTMDMVMHRRHRGSSARTRARARRCTCSSPAPSGWSRRRGTAWRAAAGCSRAAAPRAPPPRPSPPRGRRR